MEKPVNFAEIRIDPAPFQLVEKSNLLKVGFRAQIQIVSRIQIQIQIGFKFI